MNQTMRRHWIKQCLALVVTLSPCHPVTLSSAPEKPKADEKKTDQAKKTEEPETRFTIHGGFAHGILLQRQEKLNTLAFSTTRDPLLVPEDYQVSIDWGDNSGVTHGQLTSVGRHGHHEVTGHHNYAATGRYPVEISVTNPDGTTAVVRSHIEVGDLYAGSLDDWTVTSIPADNLAGSAGDLQATLDWGDGSPAATGIVRREGDVFRVSGSHAYALDGPYTVSVLLTDGAAVKLVRKRAIRVVRRSLILQTHGVSVNSFTNAEVASFRVPNPLATAREFAALIDWGDGTPLDTAVIVGSGGQFRVLASHTYEPGSYHFTVLVMQQWH